MYVGTGTNDIVLFFWFYMLYMLPFLSPSLYGRNSLLFIPKKFPTHKSKSNGPDLLLIDATLLNRVSNFPSTSPQNNLKNISLKGITL